VIAICLLEFRRDLGFYRSEKRKKNFWKKVEKCKSGKVPLMKRLIFCSVMKFAHAKSPLRYLLELFGK
jgi:hypothetical protein